MPLFLILVLSLSPLPSFAMHCPGCDTTEPSYGSSSFENRREAGKYQPGDGRTPYDRPESNIERDNREQREQEAREERSAAEQRQRQERQRYQAPSTSTYGSDRYGRSW